jgi:hypothetical protein
MSSVINAVGNALTGATGTGNFVGANTPTLITPNLGTPASGTLTSCTGLPLTTGITASFTAGGLVYSTVSELTIASAGTSGQLAQSAGTSAPSWTTSTYPATNAANTLLYASSANTMAALSTSDNGLLVTSASGVPSIGNAIGADITVNSLTVGQGAYNDSNSTNSAFGITALSHNSSGTQNTAIGRDALKALTSGSENASLGSLASYQLTTGSENTVIGCYAGAGIAPGVGVITGSGNTLIGYQADVSSTSAIGTIAIGVVAIADGATGSTSGTNGPGISIGSSAALVGFRGDGSIYPGPLGSGNWRVNVNGTYYAIPLLPDKATTLASIITAPAASQSSSLTIGSAYQNSFGYDVVLTVYLAVASATSASITLGVGSTNTPTAQTIVSSLTLAAVNIIPVTIYLPTGYYALLNTSGTISASISGQQAMPV